MNRLRVNKILSVGAVEPSEILLWKARDKGDIGKDEAESILRPLRIRRQKAKPSMSRKDIESEIPRTRPDIARALGKASSDRVGSLSSDPVARAEAVVKHIDGKLKQQTRALSELREGYRKIGNDLREVQKMTGRTHPTVTVREQVDALATELVQKGEAPNLTQAKPMVWKSRPDLVAASRANREGAAIHVPGGKTPKAGTIADDIVAIVKRRADEISTLPGMWDKHPVEWRNRVWQSPQGRKLRLLYSDSMRRKDRIEKSGQHSEAFAIMKRWNENPAEGLR